MRFLDFFQFYGQRPSVWKVQRITFVCRGVLHQFLSKRCICCPDLVIVASLKQGGIKICQYQVKSPTQRQNEYSLQHITSEVCDEGISLRKIP